MLGLWAWTLCLYKYLPIYKYIFYWVPVSQLSRITPIYHSNWSPPLSFTLFTFSMDFTQGIYPHLCLNSIHTWSCIRCLLMHNLHLCIVCSAPNHGGDVWWTDWWGDRGIIMEGVHLEWRQGFGWWWTHGAQAYKHERLQIAMPGVRTLCILHTPKPTSILIKMLLNSQWIRELHQPWAAWCLKKCDFETP